jgi:hypothetical protein
MNTISLLIIYAFIAAVVTAHVFYYGVLTQPRINLFSISDQGILAITSLAVGAIWLLFVPTLTALLLIRMVNGLRARTANWTLSRAQHARAGS